MHDERALFGALLNLNLTDATRIRGDDRILVVTGLGRS